MIITLVRSTLFGVLLIAFAYSGTVKSEENEVTPPKPTGPSTENQKNADGKDKSERDPTDLQPANQSSTNVNTPENPKNADGKDKSERDPVDVQRANQPSTNVNTRKNADGKDKSERDPAR